MSTTEVCQSCRAPAAEDFCSECFAPVAPTAPLFTRAQAAPLALPASPSATSGGKRPPPDLRRLEYRPPSWLTRLRMKSRGTVASVMVGSFLLVSSAYFWVDQHRDQAAERHLQARSALNKGDYKAAQAHYEASFRLHQEIFDETGQVQDLIAQARCLEARGQYDDAMARVARAGEIEMASDVVLATARIHRQIGLRTLEEAHASLSAADSDAALAQADQALHSLEVGNATGAQRAGAHRVAALALAQLGQGERAEDRLTKARELDGANTAANRQVAARMAKLESQHKARKAQRELAWKRKQAEEAATLARARRNRPAVAADSSYQAAQAHPTYQAPVYNASPYQGYSTAPSHSQLPKPAYPTYHRPVDTYDPSQQPQPNTYAVPSIPAIPDFNAPARPAPPVYKPTFR